MARSEKVSVAVALMVGHGGGIGLISTHSNEIFLVKTLILKRRERVNGGFTCALHCKVAYEETLSITPHFFTNT